MGSYIPATGEERQAMLQAIGLTSVDELFDVVPEAVRVKNLDLPEGLSEWEVSQTMASLAEKNRVFRSVFRGAGAYRHYIPSIVKTVTSKEEFLTAYTPYQAEISQGVLQSIFEYQTQMCELTGMEVSNASVYDGAVAAAEAIFMCQERKRTSVVVSGAADPQTLAVIKTYCESRDVPVTILPVDGCATDPAALQAVLAGDTAAVYVQSPNYFGVLEDMDAIVSAAHGAGAKVIMGVNPISLGLLKTPGEYGVDIAVGEGQPLGMPLSFGGPYLGFMTCKKAMMRKLPGRIVGQTTDAQGNRCFVLTLQAREQHIRREKASSNICSNEALCAMTASVYLAAMGPPGPAAGGGDLCRPRPLSGGGTGQAGLSLRSGEKPFFHEFCTDCPMDPALLCAKLEERGILGGLPVDGGILWCCTELKHQGGHGSTHRGHWGGAWKMKLLFERSRPGRGNDLLPPCDVPVTQFDPSLLRGAPLRLPEIAEVDLGRHYTELAKQTHGVNDGFYPLGSCTMKYNPRVNEEAAAQPGFTQLHPLQPVETVQGALEVLATAERLLCEITGMDGMSFQPAAGAHGEYTGLLLIRKYHQSRGDAARTKILVPDAAHGTTPPRPPWRDSRWSPFPPTRRAEWIWTPCARRWDRIPLA